MKPKYPNKSLFRPRKEPNYKPLQIIIIIFSIIMMTLMIIKFVKQGWEGFQ